MSSFLSDTSIAVLREEIQHHRTKYYAGEPEITDAEFDALFHQLKELELLYPETITPDSPTQTVRFAVQTELKKQNHLVPMISLDNAYSDEDLQDWEARWRKIIISSFEGEQSLYIVEPKFDGLGISCVFENGKLSRALTRGDGTEGEDVTENIKTFLPHFSVDSSEVFEMRGEVVMKKSEFLTFNTRLEKEGKKLSSNPRNAAAGALRQLDANITKSRNLSVFFYETPLKTQQIFFNTYQSVLSYFEKQQIPHPPHYFACKTLSEVIEKIHFLRTLRESLDYDIDGVVVKINSFVLRDEIGSTNHHPRWAIAYKFPAKQVSTKVGKVEWQVGRTGVLTPVAHLVPVTIDGVMVARATLHNFDHIQSNDIREGDEVILERSGEVIPKIIMPLVAKRTGKEVSLLPPLHCPVCHAAVLQKDEEVAIRCSNAFCPEVLKGKLEYFASKKAMNIEGLGSAVASALVEKNLVKTLGDLFTLTKEDLFRIEGFQQKSVDNLFFAIQESRKNPLWRWIAAASIPLIGEKTAKTLASHFNTIEALQAASFESLIAIPEVGEKVANEILQFLHTPEHASLFDFQMHISLENRETGDLASDVFAGMSFVFTGTLASMSREKAGEWVERHGGTVVSSLSKNTSVLVCGANAASKKTKAQELGVQIWTEEEFLAKQSFPEKETKILQNALF